jgi:predicted HicB family RNase H-like nuclease
MENVLTYKKFIATVQYSEEDEAFVGRIEGIDSVVSFEGTSVDELKSAFQEAVESYLDFCRRKGIANALKKGFSVVAEFATTELFPFWKQFNRKVMVSSHIIKPAQLKSRLLGEHILWSKYELKYSETSDESQPLDEQFTQKSE